MCDMQLIRRTNTRVYDFFQGKIIGLQGENKNKKNLHMIISISRFSSSSISRKQNLQQNERNSEEIDVD